MSDVETAEGRVSAAREFLATKLSSSDLARVRVLLGGVEEDDGDEDPDKGADRRARDRRALDSKRRKFVADRLSKSELATWDALGEEDDRRPPAMDTGFGTRAVRSFFRLFPDAVRVKGV